MKTNSYFSIAAIAALTLVSCNKLDTPVNEPVIYTLQNAKINLGFTNNQGPIGCIELNDDGTYFAEVFADYEGLDNYLQLPFERIMVGVKDSRATNYISGSYTPTDGAYTLSGLGVLSFDSDKMFANYTYDGISYRDRTGVTPAEKLPSTFKPATGKWTPAKTEIKVTNLVDNSEFTNTYNNLDLEKISTDVAATCVPALAEHLHAFKGYSLNKLNVSVLNTFSAQYANGKNLGGYWDFNNRAVAYSKSLGNGKQLGFNATLIPSVAGGKLSIDMAITITINGEESYQVSAKIEMN